MKYAISLKNVSKDFYIPKKKKDLSFLKRKLSWIYREWETFQAVKSMNFTVKKGEILGYLGPNGAGKSTTVKMLTGILTPSKGIIRVLGVDPHKDRNTYKRQLGVMFGQRQTLDNDVALIESYKLFKDIYDIPQKAFQERLEKLANMLEIQDLLETPYRMLSLGQRIRSELIGVFLHKPKIVFLDEPTIGLDAHAKVVIRDFLKIINKEEQTTILITSHDMDDIEELCQRIILIAKGEKYYDGTLSAFKKKHTRYKIVDITFTKTVNKELYQKILKKTQILEKQKGYLKLKIKNENIAQTVKEFLDTLEVVDLKLTEPTLERILAKMYSGELKNESL